MDFYEDGKTLARAFKMLCWSQTLRIPWTSRVTEDEVLQRVDQKCTLIEMIKKGGSWIDHLLTIHLLEGNVGGKTKRGQPTNFTLDYMEAFVRLYG